jgi:hypothetical protein
MVLIRDLKVPQGKNVFSFFLPKEVGGSPYKSFVDAKLVVIHTKISYFKLKRAIPSTITTV